MPEQTLTITLYAQGDAIATAAVIKLLLDWLLPLGLVYETALLPPHMRYSRISEPTREVFRIPLPGSQWAQHASGSTEAPAGGAATSRGAAEPAPPPIKRLRGKVPPPPPLLPPKIPEDRPLSPTPSLHPDEQDDGKAMGARDPSSPPPPSSPTDMPEASQLPSPTTPAKSAEFGVEGADQTPEGWEAHPESGYGSTSTSGCWSGGDGPGDSGWKPPLPSDPPLPFPLVPQRSVCPMETGSSCPQNPLQTSATWWGPPPAPTPQSESRSTSRRLGRR